MTDLDYDEIVGRIRRREKVTFGHAERLVELIEHFRLENKAMASTITDLTASVAALTAEIQALQAANPQPQPDLSALNTAVQAATSAIAAIVAVLAPPAAPAA